MHRIVRGARSPSTPSTSWWPTCACTPGRSHTSARYTIFKSWAFSAINYWMLSGQCDRLRIFLTLSCDYLWRFLWFICPKLQCIANHKQHHFPQLITIIPITERFGIDHKKIVLVKRQKNVINRGHFFFVIYQKHVSDWSGNFLTLLFGRNIFSNSVKGTLLAKLLFPQIIMLFDN